MTDLSSRQKNLILLTAMAIIQTTWLAGIWILGASENIQKVILLMLLSVLAFLVMAFSPEGWMIWFRKIGSLAIMHQRVFLLCISLLFIGVCILYAHYQRLWEFDEAQNLMASSIVAQEGITGLLSRYHEIDWLARQHPPLIPILNGLVMSAFGIDLVVMRVISILFGLGALILTYAIGRYLYDPKIGMLAAFFFMCFPLIVRLSSAGLLDVQFTFLLGLSVLLLLFLLDRPSWLLVILLGFALGAGVLTKYSMFLVFPVLFFLVLLRGKLKTTAAYLAVAILIAGSIYALWLIQAYRFNIAAPGVQVITLIQENVISVEAVGEIAVPPEVSITSTEAPLEGHIGGRLTIGWFLFSLAGWKILANVILTQLPSAIGPYNFVLLVLGLWIIIRRRNISDWIIMIWIVVISAILLLTIPDHRYFMAMFPALAIMMGAWMKSNPLHGERVVGLTLLYWIGALYLFIDWSRVGPLFGSN